VDQTTIAALVEAAVEPQPDTGMAAETGTRPMRRPSNLIRAAAPASKIPPAREVANVGEDARLIQLGAYDSEALTRDAWARLVAEHGDLLGEKSLYVERTTANARVFYRLRVASFENADESRALCEALRARGVDCIPVMLQ
jgi:cell division septation protein DedD